MICYYDKKCTNYFSLILLIFCPRSKTFILIFRYNNLVYILLVHWNYRYGSPFTDGGSKLRILTTISRSSRVLGRFECFKRLKSWFEAFLTELRRLKFEWKFKEIHEKKKLVLETLFSNISIYFFVSFSRIIKCVSISYNIFNFQAL